MEETFSRQEGNISTTAATTAASSSSLDKTNIPTNCWPTVMGRPRSDSTGVFPAPDISMMLGAAYSAGQRRETFEQFLQHTLLQSPQGSGLFPLSAHNEPNPLNRVTESGLLRHTSADDGKKCSNSADVSFSSIMNAALEGVNLCSDNLNDRTPFLHPNVATAQSASELYPPTNLMQYYALLAYAEASAMLPSCS